MLKIEQNLEVCDATEDDSSNAAGLIKILQQHFDKLSIDKAINDHSAANPWPGIPSSSNSHHLFFVLPW